MITTNGSAQIVLRNLRAQIGLSQRKTAIAAARDIGPISQAAISLMEAGKAPVDIRYENWLRVRAGERAVTVPACPDCGSVHHARCNGHAGPVVVLAATEKVVRARRPSSRPRKRHRWSATDAQEARRAALGVAGQKVIDAGLDALEGRR